MMVKNLSYRHVLIYLYSFFMCFEYIFTVIGFAPSVFKPYRILAFLIIIDLLFSRNIKYDLYDKLHYAFFSIGILLSLFAITFKNQNYYYLLNFVSLFLIAYLPTIYIKNNIHSIEELKNMFKCFYFGIISNVVFILYNVFVLKSFIDSLVSLIILVTWVWHPH